MFDCLCTKREREKRQKLHHERHQNKSTRPYADPGESNGDRARAGAPNVKIPKRFIGYDEYLRVIFLFVRAVSTLHEGLFGRREGQTGFFIFVKQDTRNFRCVI